MAKEKKKMVVQKEIYKAIAYFIERQHLVAQAMRDLGLDLEEVGKWGAAVWASLGAIQVPNTLGDDRIPNDIRKLFDLRAKIKKLSQTGIWGAEGEWEYVLHGGGCRLHHIQTGEVIDWNCPNIDAFDPYFFLDHLRWRLNFHHNEDELQYTRNWIEEHSGDFDSVIILIEEMINEGLINKDFTLPDFDSIL